jgi:hypothetical protein
MMCLITFQNKTLQARVLQSKSDNKFVLGKSSAIYILISEFVSNLWQQNCDRFPLEFLIQCISIAFTYAFFSFF